MATANPYPLSCQHLLRARIDVLTADVRAAAVTGGYTPSDTHGWWSDVSWETSGPGYTPGGLPLTMRTGEYDPASRATVLRCNQLTWLTTGWSVRYLVFYAFTGTAGASPLLSWADLGEQRDLGGEPFIVPFPAGVYRLAPAS